jgi:hypothetical protein
MNIVVCLIWAKMLVLTSCKVALWLAYQFHALASTQDYSSNQLT